MSQLDFLNFDEFSGDEEADEVNIRAGQKRPGEKENDATGNKGIEVDGLKGQEEVEIELKKKPRKKPRPFNEDVLTNRDGLLRIYEEFPNSCKFRGRGKEAEDLKRLLGMYKEWAFQLYPNLALPDILSRCDSLGGKGKVRSNMEQLRDRERCRYLNEVLQVPISEIRMRVLADINPSPSPNTSRDATSPLRDELAEFGQDILESPIHALTSPTGGKLGIPLHGTVSLTDIWDADEDDALLLAIAQEEEEKAAALRTITQSSIAEPQANEAEALFQNDETSLFQFTNDDEDDDLDLIGSTAAEEPNAPSEEMISVDNDAVVDQSAASLKSDIGEEEEAVL